MNVFVIVLEYPHEGSELHAVRSSLDAALEYCTENAGDTAGSGSFFINELTMDGSAVACYDATGKKVG